MGARRSSIGRSAMKTIRRSILRLPILTLAGAVALMTGTGAYAASGTGTANVEITKPVSLSEGAPLDFGTINAPSTGSNTFDFTTDGTLALSGDGDAFHADDETLGAWTVTGETGASVSVNVAFDTWSDPAITTDAVYVNGPSDTTSVTLTDGTAALTIGGKITITNAVTEGAKTSTVTVTANYQ